MVMCTVQFMLDKHIMVCSGINKYMRRLYIHLLEKCIFFSWDNDGYDNERNLESTRQSKEKLFRKFVLKSQNFLKNSNFSLEKPCTSYITTKLIHDKFSRVFWNFLTSVKHKISKSHRFCACNNLCSSQHIEWQKIQKRPPSLSNQYRTYIIKILIHFIMLHNRSEKFLHKKKYLCVNKFLPYTSHLKIFFDRFIIKNFFPFFLLFFLHIHTFIIDLSSYFEAMNPRKKRVILGIFHRNEILSQNNFFLWKVDAVKWE